MINCTLDNIAPLLRAHKITIQRHAQNSQTTFYCHASASDKLVIMFILHKAFACFCIVLFCFFGFFYFLIDSLYHCLYPKRS